MRKQRTIQRGASLSPDNFIKTKRVAIKTKEPKYLQLKDHVVVAPGIPFRVIIKKLKLNEIIKKIKKT